MLLNYIFVLVYLVGISVSEEPEDILQYKDQRKSALQPLIELISQFKTFPIMSM